MTIEPAAINQSFLLGGETPRALNVATSAEDHPPAGIGATGAGSGANHLSRASMLPRPEVE